MTRREFELVRLDPQVREVPTGGTGRVTCGEFTAIGRLQTTPVSDLFPLTDDLNQRARAEFELVAQDAHDFPFGDLRLEDVYLTGPRGMIIDRARSQILVGETLGWTQPSVGLDVADLLSGEMTPEGTAMLPDLVFDRPKRARNNDARPPSWKSDPTRKQPPIAHAELEIVSSPGYAIYGHWLIDVVPRLLRIQESPSNAPLFSPKTPDFAAQMLDALGIELEPWVQSYTGALVHAEHAWIRTQPKFARILDPNVMLPIWQQLAEALRSAHVGGKTAELIYVSRARWSAGRVLINHHEVEAHLEARGYRILHPQDHTLAEQAHLFAHARHVIGEDGSGLHNIVYAHEPLTLSVIDLDRHNPFHASVANAAGHRVAHLAADEVDDGWALSLDRLDAHLEALGLS